MSLPGPCAPPCAPSVSPLRAEPPPPRRLRLAWEEKLSSSPVKQRETGEVARLAQRDVTEGAQGRIHSLGGAR